MSDNNVTETLIGAVTKVIGANGEGGAGGLLPLKPNSMGLSIKLGLRFYKSVRMSRSPGGLASLEFISSASSFALTFAALMCETASKVVPYINCPQFVPLLTSGAVSTSVAADHLSNFAAGKESNAADFAGSVF